MAGTCAALFLGLQSMTRSDRVGSQLAMRARVGFQAATVAILAAGFYMAGLSRGRTRNNE